MVNSGLKIKSSKKVKIRKARKSSWTIAEQRAYIDFLKKNIKIMRKKESRRGSKVFKLMAQAIGTRTSVQAKTHHQKMQEKYQTTWNIIHKVDLVIRNTMILQAEQDKVADFDVLQKVLGQNTETSIRMEMGQDHPDRQNGQICSNLFFDCSSEDYSRLEWQSIMDLNEPMI